VEIRPDPATFRALADRAPCVPVWCEWLGDTDTPLLTFARARTMGDAAFLLESVEGGERWARHSFVGVGHRAHVRGRFVDGELAFDVVPGPGLAAPVGDRSARGLSWMRSFANELAAEPHGDLPPFWGGLVGVWGHDLVRAIERLPAPPLRVPAGVPPVELVATDTVIGFDALAQRMVLVATACPSLDGGVDAAYEGATARLHQLWRALQCGARLPPLHLPAIAEPVPRRAPPFTREAHVAAVARARAHIHAGDAFQIVLAQAFEEPQAGLDPLDVYRVLRATNPAPYMVALQLPAATLVGASPEVLVRLGRDRTVTLRPIAGTLPRGRDEAEDRANEVALLADPKEKAEHLMLVDLGRNDLGRIAEPGTVRVHESFVVERYSRVMHIVSELRARLRAGLSAIDVLAATFPAGTLSGAPKVRALQIIDALEPAERGWYGGAVGYLGYDGGADFAICIRCAVADGTTFRVGAGSGIVYDSDPEREDAECVAKASALLRAIAIARGARSGGTS
jgi:anthranilate synthase component I